MHNNNLKKIFCLFKRKKIISASFIIILLISIFSFNYIEYKKNIKNDTNKHFFYKKVDNIIDIYNLKINKIKNAIFNKHDKVDINNILTMLEKSKNFLEKKQFDKSIEQITNALKFVKDENINNILNIRLARIYLQQKKTFLAIQHLEKVKNIIWIPVKYNYLGDAFLTKGDKKSAREAWKKGIEYDEFNTLKEIMQMKINDLNE